MHREVILLIVCLLSSTLILLGCISTIVQQPTPTPVPSPTPTSIPSPVPIIAPPTPTLTPNLAVITAPLADTWSSLSPNGQWTAQGMMTVPFSAADNTEQYHTRLEVVNPARAVTWTLADQTLNYGLGYTTPRPFHWSADGRYLYFTNLAVPDGCSLFHNGSDLYRADLSTGQITEIVPPWVWWVSLSADEKMVAFIRWNGQVAELVIQNLTTENKQQATFEKKYTQAGSIVWSPDGLSLALTLVTNPCDSSNWAQAIARVDLTTPSPTLLIPDDKRLFRTVEWPEVDRVILTDQAGKLWTLEISSGKLKEKRE